ncbi:MAG: hypothetical protein ACKOI2_12820 [Actinomycetota bacterium]
MSLIGIGISWRETSLGVLAHYGRRVDRVRRVIDDELFGLVRGRIVLSTCNRFEVVADVEPDRIVEGAERLRDVLERDFESPIEQGCFVIRFGLDAVHHLFRVTSGLESILVGETEITGQVRTAAKVARSERRTTSLIERVVDRAVATSRHVRPAAFLDGRSLLGLGVDIASELLDGFSGRSALVIGSGSYARSAVVMLSCRGVEKIHVHSPSGRQSVWRLDEKFNSSLAVVGDAELGDCLSNVDLALGCSGQTDPVVGASRSHFLEGRRVVVIDLSLSPDFDSRIAEHPGVSYVGLDEVFGRAQSLSVEDGQSAAWCVATRAHEFVTRYGLASNNSVNRPEAMLKADVGR